MSDKTTIRSLDVGMLKGKVNGVTLVVSTDFCDGAHTLSFYLDTRGHGDNEVGIREHKHPWGNKLKTTTCDPEDYAEDIKKAREAAWLELELRNLDNPTDWHDSGV